MEDDEIELSGPQGLQGVAGAQGVASVSASAAASTEALSGAGAVDSDTAIAEALSVGRIDATQAQALLIEQIIAEQIPSGAPDLVERLRVELNKQLSGDPTLAALLIR